MFGWVTFLELDFWCTLSPKIDVPNFVMDFNWILIYEWYVV